MSAIDRAAEALIPYSSAYTNRHMQARRVFMSIDVDELARVVGSVHKRETETYGQYDRRRARAVRNYLLTGDESDE